MNRMNNILSKLATVAALMITVAVMAVPRGKYAKATAEKSDSIVADTVVSSLTDDNGFPIVRWLPGEIRDTTQYQAEMEARRLRDLQAKINVMTRCYGDSVVLRWAADDYVTWRFLNHVGVNIVRMDEETFQTDTLVMGLKPLTLEHLRTRYAETDSVAGMAMGALYGEGQMTQQESSYETGSVGSLYDVSQEQQLQYGIALLASEWRQDVAESIALRYTDRTARKGRKYTYIVRPTEYDSTLNVMVRVGMVEEVENTRFKAEPFDVKLSDSISAPSQVFITWEDRGFSSYEVERRRKGTAAWQRLNERPYIIMNSVQGGDCFYSDDVEQPGTYEYRVMAHDPFGDLTDPSPIHEVTVADMTAPAPPRLTWIEIERPHEDDPSKQILAHIHFQKDTIEADFAGCVPMYYHERITEGKWKPLVEKPLSPADTVVTVDVTNLVTGQVVVAAYDTAQNVSYSIPQLLRVSDMKSPAAPRGLCAKAEIVPTDSVPLGLIHLSWHPIDDDDIDYYEITFANDSTHEWMTRRNGIVHGDTLFTDTVAVDVNQKYIYYKVRAVDYSTNLGEYSEPLPVIRPSAIPPTVAHLDSTHVDDKAVFMRWIVGSDEQMAYHNVYRRLIDSEKTWTLLKRCDGDSVKLCNDYIDITDIPAPNSSEEYVYAVESFNFSDISSGLSLQYCTFFRGETVFSLPLRLFATYDKENDCTRLAWECDEPPAGTDWYFCIYRQGKDDERPKFLLSAQPDERDFVDYLLQPGETAYYYIQVQMEDGRESEPSNIVSVKSPTSDGK